MKSEIFKNLFVLEIANNHWGDVKRGLKIINDHADVVEKNGIHAAIKLQLRDIDTFVHSAQQENKLEKGAAEIVVPPGKNSRYVKKTLSTKLTKDELQQLVNEVKKRGLIAMATPFDEKSVDLCVELGIDVLKIASQDTKAVSLIDKILEAKIPTAVSNGGTDIEDMDRIVELFEKKGVPLAVNHCVSLYPSENSDLHLSQIDFLVKRYPNNVIGLSTHEYNDWVTSVTIAYAKGARTFERHVDIDADGITVSKYCSLPEQVDTWFKAFLLAKEMVGDGEGARNIPQKERDYIQSVSRGMYAKKDLEKGHVLTKESLDEDFYFAIPLEDNQYSARELGEEVTLKESVKKDQPIFK
tara:strand:- start:17853 stop:18917 length:1065 start_codon:yes stop_codon:yes gene_type:complete